MIKQQIFVNTESWRVLMGGLRDRSCYGFGVRCLGEFQPRRSTDESGPAISVLVIVSKELQTNTSGVSSKQSLLKA